MARTPLLSMVGLALSASLGGVALAQSGPPEPSSSEKLRDAQNGIQEVAEIIRYVEGLLAQTTADTTVTRSQCVSKKLDSLRTLSEIVMSSSIAMEGFLASGNDGQADREYRVVDTSVNRARTLRAEADACIGQKSDAQTSIVVEEEQTGSEASGGIDTQGIGSDPPDSSPYQ